MNKVFKVIWNHTTQSWIAVSELATSKGKQKSKRAQLTAISVLTGVAMLGSEALASTSITDGSSGVTTISIADASISATSAGNNSLAMGNNANAAALNAIAIGNTSSVADRATGGIAIGHNANISINAGIGNANSTNAIAIGTNATAPAQDAVVIGHGAYVEQTGTGLASGQHAVAIGTNSTSMRGGIAIGHNSSSQFSSAVAIGENAVAGKGVNSGDKDSFIAVGANAIATGAAASAFGTSANATTVGAVALGTQAKAVSTDGKGNYATAVGFNAQAIARDGEDGPTAFGYNAVARGGGAIAIGRENNANGSDSTAIGTQAKASDFAMAIGRMSVSNPYFAIAMGIQSSVNNGATSGIAIGGASSVFENASRGIAIGAGAQTASNYGISVGRGTATYGQSAIAVGSAETAATQRSLALGTNSSAVGTTSLAVGTNTIALGAGAISGIVSNEAANTRTDYTNYASSQTANNKSALDVRVNTGSKNTIAIGNATNAYADNAISIGNNSKSGGINSISAGNENNVTGNYSGAIGDTNTLSANTSYAFGNNNNISSNNVFILGNHVNVSSGRDGGVVLGDKSDLATVRAVNNATVGTLSYGGFAGNLGGTTTGSDATDQGRFVSIGKSGEERQIHHVAAGEITSTSTHAINGSQLYFLTDILNNVGTTTANVIGGNATLSANGTLSNFSQPLNTTGLGDTATYAYPATNATNVSQAITNLNNYVNAGWIIGNNTLQQVARISPNEQVNYVNGNGTTANVVVTKSGSSKNNDGKNIVKISYDVNLTTGSINENGIVKVEEGNNFLNASQVAHLINNSSFNVTTEKKDEFITNQEGKEDKAVKAGDTVTYTAGKNIAIKQEGANFTFATEQNVTFTNTNVTNNLTIGEGNNATVITKGSISNLNHHLNAPSTNTNSNVTNATQIVNPTLTENDKKQAATVNDVLNSGWNLRANNNSVDAVTHNNSVDFSSEDGSVTITATTDGSSTKLNFSVNTTNLTSNTSFNVTTAEKDEFIKNQEGKENKTVKTGETITYTAGKNIAIKQDGANFTFATKPDVTFDNANVNGTLAIGSNNATTPIVNITTGIGEHNNNGTLTSPSTLNMDNSQVTNVSAGSNVYGQIVDANGRPLTAVTTRDASGNAITNYYTPDQFTENGILKDGATSSSPMTTSNIAKAVSGLADLSSSNATNVMTIADAKNLGWIVSTSDNEYADNVKNTNRVDFKAETGTGMTVKGSTHQETGVREIVIGNDYFKTNATTESRSANAIGTNAIAIGSNAIAHETSSISIGENANVSLSASPGSVAIGKDAIAGKANLGTYSIAHSITTIAGIPAENTRVFSVGNTSNLAQIQNVAAGVVSENSTDAVNGSQLHATNQMIVNNNQSIGNLNNKIDQVDKRNRKGTAIAGAIGMLPQPHISGKSMVSGATTNYRGEQAFAIGYSRLSDNGKHIIKFSGSSNLSGKKDGMVGAAYGFQW